MTDILLTGVLSISTNKKFITLVFMKIGKSILVWLLTPNSKVFEEGFQTVTHTHTHTFTWLADCTFQICCRFSPGTSIDTEILQHGTVEGTLTER